MNYPNQAPADIRTKPATNIPQTGQTTSVPDHLAAEEGQRQNLVTARRVDTLRSGN